MGEVVDIRSGEVIEGEVVEPDALDRLDAAEPPLIPAGEFIEQRVRLTRQEFAAVAAGEYPAGRTPEHGGPVIIDKRGSRNPSAAAHKAEQQAREQQRQAQAHWTQQAAGTMFWEAQRVAVADPDLGEAILAKRAELVAGAKKKGILV
ncbi:hypothetical protein I5G58_gp082 [Mycobacterium phage BirdsNest]|uniref:Uncharacterized protein n=1 Tax=Mycobacterium phage BirdsNest TaxID=2686231 RepID=A0A6B9LHS5_9CAUD|nr:hypothetical protein I5G58_gp082 [Mycobacterium phage BirdsNest]QHB37384.1 hypothetical protein PBI_BIRDSNEST_82 [Mycobacterium phage BirdsNest]